MLNNKDPKLWAKDIRIKCIEMTYHAGNAGGHLGGALSSAEILSVLYCKVANLNKYNSHDPNRDRIIVSKAHCGIALFAALNNVGLIEDAVLGTFSTNGTTFHDHPVRNLDRGLEFSGGSLGLGISFADGVALSCKLAGIKNRIFVLLGDGECDEGIVWEALAFAKDKELNNMTVIVDRNKMQGDGYTKDILDMTPLEDKFSSFGFSVETVDGHDVKQLEKALKKEFDVPNVIIADTIKGKGVSFLEGNAANHIYVLKEKEYLQAKAELLNED